MAETLNTTYMGNFEFFAEVGGKTQSYICTGVVLSLRLNAVPTASVVIGCGSSILNPGSRDNSAENLLEAVNDAIKSGSNFIDCSIYETRQTSRGMSEKICVFKGCIISASLVYKTGNITMRGVRFECMNNICRLYCQPFGLYNLHSGSAIVNQLIVDAPDNGKAAQIPGFQSMDDVDTADVCGQLSDKLDHKDIVTKFAILSDAIASLVLLPDNDPLGELKNVNGDLLKIADYMYCNYGINYKELSKNNQTDPEFNERLCSQLKATLRNGSILDAILSIITSTDYMLTLVPRFGDDFKMELRPSKAWDYDTTVKLGFDSVFEINSTYSPLAHINDPEVFIADFSETLEWCQGSGTVGKSDPTLIGAYSKDQKVAEYIKMRFMSNDAREAKGKEIADIANHYKWRSYPAPEWLRTCFLDVDGPNNENTQIQLILNQRSKDKEGDPDPKPAPSPDYNFGDNVADKVAQALFTHIYGASSTAQIAIMPNISFGHTWGSDGQPFVLENHIGDVIDIMSENEADKPLNIRGMLEGLQFEYTGGQSSNCRYTAMLSRVRPYQEDEPKIKCPLYAETK